MNIFISFRYTGEATESLQQFFYPVRDALTDAGHTVYLSLDDLETWGQNELSMSEKFSRTFAHLSAADSLLVFVRSNDRSEGMLMEVGYAFAERKPIYLLRANGVQTFIADVATETRDFTNDAEAVVQAGKFYQSI